MGFETTEITLFLCFNNDLVIFRIVQTLSKDRKSQGRTDEDKKIPESESADSQASEGVKERVRDEKAESDKLTERMDSTHQPQHSVISNIKSFMLNKLMKKKPAKKPVLKLRSKNVSQLKVQPNLKAHMPVFPNFPQKEKKTKKTQFRFQPLQMKNPVKQKIVKQQAREEVSSVIDKFVNDQFKEPNTKQSEREEFDFGFKMFPLENFNSESKQIQDNSNPSNVIPFPTFSP